MLACETHYLEPEPFVWKPAHRQGPGRPQGHPAAPQLARRADADRPRRRGDGPAGRRGQQHRRVDRRARPGRRGRPARPRRRAGHAVRRVLPAAAPDVAPDDRGPGALARSTGRSCCGPRPTSSSAGRSGTRAASCSIDLKSGRIVDRHREDLRFYALVETLAREVPPRSVASFSLEAGEAVVDQVNEAMLRSSLRRTLDAIARMIELRRRGPPRRAPPGVTCRWCRLATDCAPGAAYLRPTGRRRRRPVSGQGVIRATGRPRPASSSTVAIERPGCTAGLASVDRGLARSRPRPRRGPRR